MNKNFKPLTNEEHKDAEDFVKSKMKEAEDRKKAHPDKYKSISDKITETTNKYNDATEKGDHMKRLKYQGEMHTAMNERFSFLYD